MTGALPCMPVKVLRCRCTSYFADADLFAQAGQQFSWWCWSIWHACHLHHVIGISVRYAVLLRCKAAAGLQPAVPGSSLPPAAPEHVSAEGIIFDNSSAIVDSAFSQSLHEKACRLPQLRDRLLQHQRSMFACATEAGCKQKERDWLTYCHLMHGNKIPDLDSMAWPPSEEDWLKFLQNGRKQVSSHECLTRWAGNVAEVGSRYFRRARSHGVIMAKDLDPCKLYFLEHGKMLRILKREYGVELRQVAGIDMVEARNFGYFVDLDSVLGLS